MNTLDTIRTKVRSLGKSIADCLPAPSFQNHERHRMRGHMRNCAGCHECAPYREPVSR